MKKLITTCAILATATAATFAQSKATMKSTAPKAATATSAAAAKSGPTPEELAQRSAKTMQAQLGLSAEEYKGVYEAELSYQKDLKTAKESGYEPGPGQTMQMGMTKDQRIKSVLTAEHYSKYEAAKSGK